MRAPGPAGAAGYGVAVLKTVVALVVLAGLVVVAVQLHGRALDAAPAEAPAAAPPARPPAPTAAANPPRPAPVPLAPAQPAEWSSLDALRVYTHGSLWLGLASAPLPPAQRRAFEASLSEACAQRLARDVDRELRNAASSLEALGLRDERLARSLATLELADAKAPRAALRDALDAREVLVHLARPLANQTELPDWRIRELADADVQQASCTETSDGVDCFFEGEREGLRLGLEEGVWRVRCDAAPPTRDLPLRARCAGPQPPMPACLVTALDELEACGDPAPATGRWLERQLKYERLSCTHPNGDSAIVEADSRLAGRFRLAVTLSRGGAPCAALVLFELKPELRPMHAQNPVLRLHHFTLSTRAGTVTHRAPGRVDALGPDGACTAGCVATVTCPDGTVHENPSCISWNALDSWGTGPHTSLTRRGLAPFWQCDAPNVVEGLRPPTKPDTTGDPLPPALPAP